MGLLGRSDGPGKTTNERPLRDKHLYLLTLCVNFITELIERLGHLPGGGLRSSGVPHEGSADPVSK